MSHRQPQHNRKPTKWNSRQNYSQELKENKLVLTHIELDKNKTDGKVLKAVDH